MISYNYLSDMKSDFPYLHPSGEMQGGTMKIEEAIKQTKKFRSEHERVAVNLTYTYYWLSGIMADYLKEFGLTTQQYNILRILRGQHPNPASINLLKDRMLDKNSDVSRIIDRMVAKELVDRKTCPDDRRAVNILLTEKGFEILRQADEKRDQTDSHLQALSLEDAEQLNNLLDKLRHD